MNFKLAESNLKQAMEDVLKKEAEYKSLKENLAQRSSDIEKLRTNYSRVAYALAIVVMIMMFGLCLIMFAEGPSSAITLVSHFIWFCEAIMLLYLIFPFHMLVSLGFGILASVVFELLALQRQVDTASTGSGSDDLFEPDQQLTDVYHQSQLIIFVFIKILLHSSVHAIALYLKVN